MQDRHRQFDEIFLQRTAGPYIRVNERHFNLAPATSGLRLSTDVLSIGQKVSNVPGTDMALFDHLVGNRHNSLWHFNTESLGYLEVVLPGLGFRVARTAQLCLGNATSAWQHDRAFDQVLAASS